MSNKVLSAFILLALLLASCGGTAATPLPDSASLSELAGTVEIMNPGQADFAAAAAGDALQVSGRVRTGEDGRVRLDLSTGSIIRVAPSTLFTLESNKPTGDSRLTRLKMYAGQVWISLNGGAIEVETPSGLASVRGSLLSVWIDPLTGDVWVNCVEGWCQAGNDSGALDMLAGQGAILYSFDPAASTPPPPPYLRYLTQDDIDEFLQNNPEAQDVLDNIIATASALPPLPSPTPVGECFTLTSPADGAALPDSGPVTFTWSEQPGRYKYIITFITPGGGEISLIAWENSYTKDMALLPENGTYQWKVTAYDAGLQPICTAGPFTFTKSGPVNPTPTDPPPAGCVTLLTPPNGAELPAEGQVDFTWTEYPGAYKYIVTFIQPNGYASSVLAWTPSLSQYIEAFADAGTYQWKVTVKNADIQEICTAGPFTFTKPQSVVPSPVPTVVVPTPKPGNTDTTFSNIVGPGNPSYNCVNFFQVDAYDPEGLTYVKVQYQVFDGSGNLLYETYQHLSISGAGITWSGNLAIASLVPGSKVVWWFWAIDNQGNSTYSGASTFDYMGSTNCP